MRATLWLGRLQAWGLYVYIQGKLEKIPQLLEHPLALSACVLIFVTRIALQSQCPAQLEADDDLPSKWPREWWISKVEICTPTSQKRPPAIGSQKKILYYSATTRTRNSVCHLRSIILKEEWEVYKKNSELIQVFFNTNSYLLRREKSKKTINTSCLSTHLPIYLPTNLTSYPPIDYHYKLFIFIPCSASYTTC